MKDITHEILSEIHHVLSIATEEELRRAGNLLNTSPHLRTALESLAAEKKSTSKQDNPTSRERSDSRKVASGRERSAELNFSGSARDLVKTMNGLSRSDILEACRLTGIPLSIKPKDARGRVIRRVVGVLTTLTEADRNRFLSLIRVKSDPQTEGWVGVIRKGQ
jgi:hypothetical protein